MTLDSIWENFDSVVAIATVAISTYIFFNDPIRRWRFFGYRPTALVVLIDPKINSVVFVKNESIWSFSQGGLYDSDLYDTVEDVLDRELNLDPHDYKLFYTKEVGKADLTKDWQKNNVIFGGVKLWKRVKGKAYIACFIMIDTKKMGQFSLGYGIDSVELVPLDKAKKFIDENISNESKVQVLKRAIDEAEDVVDLWKSTTGV